MVTEIVKRENSYRRAFLELQEQPEDQQVAWLERLRAAAMERFEESGFPSVKDEEWKYTNVAAIAAADFQPASLQKHTEAQVDPEALAPYRHPETAKSQLVFINGKLRQDLSELKAIPEGVVALDLSAAIADERYREIVWKHLAQEADYVVNGFTALNTALISHGAFVYIPKDAIVSVPLNLLFIADGAPVASFPRVLVVAEENSSATLIESYASTKDSKYFTNTVVEIVLKDGARLEHYKLQRESTEAFHIATTAADLGRNSSYDATTITFGAHLSRHDLHVTMDQEGAECWVDGLYLVTGSQHTDTHSVIDHRKPHCTSHQLYKGILDGKSRAVFNGKVFVRHDAQKTDAMQTNKNLLLSNEARVDTKPQLEILADDVKCAHGAAVGQIEEDELFYLETRGIHPELARNLLTYGFAEEVIAKIKTESIRLQLDEAVLHRLNARLEV
ncbi:MAG TPA: Fe-S cluster assembly protein SufD [Pyrinomonadaceae bacterium]|jgi:Fe-S cluster assembly protein SufD|nr:Fe-S cluster assembly protein SufD [Pyrinomonadaceae bacterium]